MSGQSQTTKNAILSIIQVFVSSLILLILYRYLVDELGIELLGLWSLVLAATSVTKISELGLAGGVLKYVSASLANNEGEEARSVVQTSAVIVIIVIGSITLLSYPLLSFLLGYVVPENWLMLSNALLPFALASFWFSCLAGVFQAGLEGCNRFDYRSYIQIGANVVYLSSAFAFVPSFGLLGMVYAQLSNVIVIIVVSWVTLRKVLPGLPLFPLGFSVITIKKMFKYCMNFQVISITQVICDPITKAMLSKFGSLEITGYYEMASRLLLQIRSILVSANRVLIPVYSIHSEVSIEKVRSIYINSYKMMMFFVVPLYAFLFICAPFISEIWIGEYKHEFVIIMLSVGFAWLINTLTAPAYFAFLGQGLMVWNTRSHILIAIMNFMFAYVFGMIFGSWGVVFAWCASLSFGSIVVVYGYHREQSISFWELLPKESICLLLATISGCAVGWFTYLELARVGFQASVLALSIVPFILFVFYPLYTHPKKNQLLVLSGIKNHLK